MARYSALGLTALKSRCHPGLWSSPGLSPLLSLLVVGRIHFFAAIGWKSPFFPARWPGTTLSYYKQCLPCGLYRCLLSSISKIVPNWVTSL